MNEVMNIGSVKTEKYSSRAVSYIGEIWSRVSGMMALILIAGMFIAGTVVAVRLDIPVSNIMKNYSYDILVILMVMELFTNLIAETGIMQYIAIKLVGLSRGYKRRCLVMFGTMMFLISSCLNNITAVIMILPVVFVLMNSLEVDRKYVSVFFAAILALSNTGGAASPIGDFPAITILTSGITDFSGYLTHAFPVFAFTSIVLLAVWGTSIKKEADDGGIRSLAIDNLKSQYKNVEIRFDALKWLGIVFLAMFIAWSTIPQKLVPPEIIALLGYVVSVSICAAKDVKVDQQMNLKAVFTIASFLYFAEIISQSGLLEMMAGYLQNTIENPKMLVLVLMVITSLIAGIFSAGPAAAAMMPVIVELCNGALSQQGEWIAVAYAAAICGGSSLFMWSASAGFILSSKINNAQLRYEDGEKARWGAFQYFKYGFVNYLIQISIALLIFAVII